MTKWDRFICGFKSNKQSFWDWWNLMTDDDFRFIFNKYPFWFYLCKRWD